MTETNPLVQSAPKGSNPAARTKVQIASDFNTSEIVRRLGSVLRGSPPPEWTPVGIAVRANENFEALREQLAACKDALERISQSNNVWDMIEIAEAVLAKLSQDRQ